MNYSYYVSSQYIIKISVRISSDTKYIRLIDLKSTIFFNMLYWKTKPQNEAILFFIYKRMIKHLKNVQWKVSSFTTNPWLIWFTDVRVKHAKNAKYYQPCKLKISY